MTQELNNLSERLNMMERALVRGELKRTDELYSLKQRISNLGASGKGLLERVLVLESRCTLRGIIEPNPISPERRYAGFYGEGPKISFLSARVNGKNIRLMQHGRDLNFEWRYNSRGRLRYIDILFKTQVPKGEGNGIMERKLLFVDESGDPLWTDLSFEIDTSTAEMLAQRSKNPSSYKGGYGSVQRSVDWAILLGHKVTRILSDNVWFNTFPTMSTQLRQAGAVVNYSLAEIRKDPEAVNLIGKIARLWPTFSLNGSTGRIIYSQFSPKPALRPVWL